MDSSALETAIRGRGRIVGLTHSLYRYPARFPPDFASAAIAEFTEPGDWVLDPFVGGGTSAVEALALGRCIAAIDLNPLAILLTQAKTTPLYKDDIENLRRWACGPAQASPPVADPRVANTPPAYVNTLAPLVAHAALLPKRRQRNVARAVLLHVAQRAIDGREVLVSPTEVLSQLPNALDQHLDGLRAFVQRAAQGGVRPSDLPRRRVLREGDARQTAAGRPWNRMTKRFRLVVTSPPYPSVHVLYHRWQVYGRSETALPYWLTASNDGLGASHYTMGGRSKAGEDKYFETIVSSFTAIRRLLLPDTHTVQLVSFHNPASQMPRYMDAMDRAGYEASSTDLVARDVPNRRWYYRVNPGRGEAKEYLLVHRLRR